MNLKFAVRQLAKSPGFTVIAVITLALGIGLSSSSFSMANAFLLRNVPYPEADRLVRVFATSRQSDRQSHAPGNIIEIRENVTSYSAFSIFNFDNFSFGEPGQPAEQVAIMATSADFFDTLGVQPFLGRGFSAGEDEPDQPRVAILTSRSWERFFGSDPSVIGREVRLNAEPYTVIGVLPRSFDAPLVWGNTDFILPRSMHPSFRTNRADTWMHAVARLKPGVSLRQAQSELDTLAARLREQFPQENASRGLITVDLSGANMDSVSRALLWLMTGIALAMLLIACANLASLQVARAFTRSRELAIRAALGGNRWQLLSPLLAESMLLAAIGGVFGLYIASVSNSVLGNLLIINGEPGFEIPIDGRVLAFATVSAVLSGITFGFAPAWLASRTSGAEALKDGSRSATAGRSQQRLKRSLIVGEVAIALTLVGVASAFGFGSKSFLNREVGWQMNGVFLGYIAQPYDRYHDEETNRAFQRELLDRLAAIPGVEHASLSTGLPLFALGGTVPLTIDGLPPEEPGQRSTAEIVSVSSGFFATLEIPLKQGVIFSPDLSGNEAPVAVINEAFAARWWPGESAIGRRIRHGDNPDWVEIVGVVGDAGLPARLDTPETRLQLYRPLSQRSSRYLNITLRTAMPPELLTQDVREAVASLDADLPVAQPGSLRAIFERNLSNLNLVVANLGISAGMGLLIAAIGLFGVISQLTAQRTRDIGVRVALGARSRDILNMVLGEGARLLVIGILLGLPFYFLLVEVLHRAMPEMKLPGLWLLASNVGVLSAAMLMACYLPALKASRISPADALRAD